MLPEWLGRRAALTPDGLALIADSRRWTFRELDEAAAAAARLLRAELARQGDAFMRRPAAPEPRSAPPRVAVLMGNTPDFVTAVHAVAKAGCVLVPLNARLMPEELAWQLRDAGAALLLHDGDRVPLARAAAQTAGGDLRLVDGSRAGDFSRDAGDCDSRGGLFDTVGLNRLHSIVYTSGTTGKPKGAMLTFGNFWWNVTGSALNLGVRSDDLWLACMPLFHVGGLSILLRSVISGMPVLLHESFDAAAVNAAIDFEDVTLLSVVAVMLDRMLKERGNVPYPNRLRAVLVGGGPAPLPLLERARTLNVPVLPTYGLTEAASQAATGVPGDREAQPGSSGKPLFPVRLRIVRPQEGTDGAVGPGEGETGSGEDALGLSPLPPGEVGEIAVAGPTVSPGYWRDGSVAGSAEEERWFRTGDLGFLDEDGYLYVVDRREDLIVSGGENVYPAEVEAVLADHPAVAEAGVVGLPHPQWGRAPGAAIVLRPGAAEEETELLEHCRRRLAGYKVPLRIEFVAELPRNPSGKLLRRRLREMLAGSD